MSIRFFRLIWGVKKKLIRLTEEDEADLDLLVTMVQQHYLTACARNDPKKRIKQFPNGSTILRALLRYGSKVATEAVANELATSKGEVIPNKSALRREELMTRLFEDGHLGD